MEKPRELYHEEVSNLNNFRLKLDSHALYKDDLDHFSDQYEELVSQAKVITRVSDRLQKKLDTANTQIKEQNLEIKDKNDALKITVDQLVKARVGRRASTVMLTVALVLFIVEQIFLQPIIEENITIPFMDLGILLVLFFIIKSLESTLENYFLNKEKKKIINNEKVEDFVKENLVSK
jgi:hypothetical protein